MVKSKTEAWQFILYIAGATDKAVAALDNIKKYCKENLTVKYNIKVVDLLRNPELAEADQIFAIPTLVRKSPEPIRKVIGDLSNEEKVLTGLDMKPLEKI